MRVRGAIAILVCALLAALWSAAVAVDAGDVNDQAWCHGVLVTPRLALVTAQCAQRATTVVLTAENSGGAVVIQRRIAATRALTRDTSLSGFAMATLDTPVDSKSALIQFTTQETHASTLAPREPLLGFSIETIDQNQPVESDAVALGLNKFSASIAPRQLCGEEEHEAKDALLVPTQEEAIVCILEQWSDVKTCERSSSSEISNGRVVTRVAGNRKYIYGFVSSPSTSTTSSSSSSPLAVCSASGTRTSLVRLVTADTLSLIQAAILQAEESTGPLRFPEVTSLTKSEDGSSSSFGVAIDPQEPRNVAEPTISVDLPPVDVPDPEQNEDSSSSSTTESEPDQTAESPAPAPAMESHLPPNYALLSSSLNSSVGGIAVAVLIAPRFLVANAEWFTTSNTTTKNLRQPAEQVSLVLFANGKPVSVHRLWFESDFYTQHQNSVHSAICSRTALACSLVVIELERDAASPAVPFSLATSVPPQGIDMSETQLSVYEPALLRSKKTFSFNSFAMENPSVGKPTGDARLPVPGLQCMDSTEPLTSSASVPEAPFKSAVATFGSGPVLLGLSDGVETQLQVGKHVSQAFIQLAAAHHRRFLDFVSNNTVAWSETVFSVDDSWSQVSSAAVSFYGGHENKRRTDALDCGGVAIAPTFILTTASCALSHKISSISFGGRFATSTKSDERVKIENVYQVFPHPKYSSSYPISRYNIALIKLDSSVTLSKWIDLDDVVQGTGTRVVRMDYDGPTWHPEKVQDTSACAVGLLGDGHVSETDFSGLVCARPQTNNDPGAADTLLKSSTTSSLLLHKTVKGTMLVGLHLPARVIHKELQSTNPTAHLYVSVFDAMRFIKAFAEGYSFGTRPKPAPLFGAARPMNPKQTAQPQPPDTLLSSQRYVVGLRVSKDGHNFCGGSLVAPTFVLTAAHCVSEGLANWVSVGSSASSGSDTESIKVLNVRVHPLYGSSTSYSFDAAILELEAAAYAPTVALDNSVDFDDSVIGTMFGYGAASSSSSTLSPSVRILSLPLWSRESCAKVLPDIDDSFLCAGGRRESGSNNDDDEEDACTGDSGSPLIVTGSNGKDYLAGVVSSGYGCGIPGVPGLYTRVFAIVSFLNAYVVEPTWRYPGRESGDEDSRDGRSESSIDQRSPTPSTTKTPASSPAVADGGGSKSHFPKLAPRTGAAGSGFTGSTDSENREATDSDAPPQTNTTTGTSNKTNVSAAALTFESAISKVSLRGNLSLPVKNAVLQFVIGSYDRAIVSSALVDRLSDLENRVSLFSSGQLEGLVAAIDRHDALPLNQRKNRFGSIGRRRRKETGADQGESCHCSTP